MTEGRWPKNVLFGHNARCTSGACVGECPVRMLDSSTDGASRFFYVPKPVGKEAEGNPHPTRKPLKLCTYLAHLILIDPGRLLVPFAGSGSEVIGALRAGWSEVVGIERERRWLEVARRRISREGVVIA